MSSPAQGTATPNPTASPSVGIGPSTIVSLLLIVGSILTTFFGHDWGLSDNATTIATAAAPIIGAVLTYSRSSQHNALVAAQTAVYAAQVQAATIAATSQGATTATAVVNATNQLAAAAANEDPVTTEVDDSVPVDLPADQQPPTA